MLRLSAVVLAALVAATVGCGADSDREATPTGPPPRLPACVKGKAVAPPPGFPAGFPLPPGTVVTASTSPHAGQLVLAGLVPANLDEASSFFDVALPERGYRLGLGDSEANEAEAPFTGNGFRGKWKLNAIPGCPAAVSLTLVLIRQS